MAAGIGKSHRFLGQKQSIRQSQALESYRKQIEDKMTTIPEENLVEPQLHIVGSAIEASKFYVQNEELRNMFANLIASSVDSTKVGFAHPSFVEIIKLMSPIDALNTKIFINSEALPIFQVNLNLTSGGYSLQATNVVSQPNVAISYELLSSSFTNLERLGLISINYDEYFTDEKVYEDFYNHQSYKEAEHRVKLLKQSGNNTFANVELKKGIVRRTPLGLDFIRTCIVE